MIACVSMAEGGQCQSSGLKVAIEGKDAVLHSSCKNDVVLSLAVPNKLLHEWSKRASVDYVQSLNSHIVGGVVVVRHDAQRVRANLRRTGSFRAQFKRLNGEGRARVLVESFSLAICSRELYGCDQLLQEVGHKTTELETSQEEVQRLKMQLSALIDSKLCNKGTYHTSNICFSILLLF